MQARRKTIFATNRTEGSILPADVLQRIEKGDSHLGGLSPDDYHLPGNEKLNEAISRSWNRLLGAWTHFKGALEKSPNDPATTLTRDRWLLPLFQELGYGRLIVARAIEFEGKSYPISHGWQHAPIHLVGGGVDLDTRTAGVAGAARVSPHSLVQEFLNRSGEHLWGFVSNGKQLRVLRDNVSLTRQAFVQFDLEAMMTGEVYSDFALLWLLCHQSRVEADKPTDCWLERWSRAAQDQGTRALDQLRNGVEATIEALGTGFLSHSANKPLLESLRSGQLTAQDYYRQLLRLVYRLLFLFVAEDRELLLLPDAKAPARERYTRFYSLSRLRHLAERRVGTRHTDLFQVLRLVMHKLSEEGCTELGLPALGSFLFSKKAIADLEDCEISNSDLLNAIRALAFMIDRQGRRLVDYKNLRSEELGSVYEALLELHPILNSDAGTFELETVSGSERKTTGSYYTRESLVQCLLDSALDPVLDEAATKPEPEKAILSLKVCDPACGSGHFLIAAAHRIAKRLAAVRTGDAEPSPGALRTALRDVIGHCLYGVDVNPMAVELCKVSLWMEAIEPGKPLSFLDHHIRIGNSMLGATPELMAGGIPDEAFRATESDDKKACSILKKRNRAERAGWGPLFSEQDAEMQARLRRAAAALEELPDDRPEDVQLKETVFQRQEQTEEFRHKKVLADVWCSAFVFRKLLSEPGNEKSAVAITQRYLNDIAAYNVSADDQMLLDRSQRLIDTYSVFHWHLAFPEVFAREGFDVVVGNPPWVRQEMMKPIKQLLVVFKSFASTADSSVYFLEKGVDICRPRGRVALLTPNKWFRATYAEKLRTFLRQRCRVDLLIDFGHSRTLFPDADTFPAAVAFQPVTETVSDKETLRFVKAHDSDRDRHELKDLVRAHAIAVHHRNLRPEQWQLEDSGTTELLSRLMATGQPLELLLRRPILSGLKTGFNEAFYVDTQTRNAIVESDAGSEALFKKFLRGRDVKRWLPKWAEQWHIVIPSSQNRAWPWSAACGELEAEEIFAISYPMVHARLKTFEMSLRARQDKGQYWWELRACDYYEAFDQQKIVVQCIAYYSQFAFDVAGHYVNNKVIVIPTADLYLLAVLNSRVMWWIVNRNFQHMKDDGLSVDVQFLRCLPVPAVAEGQRQIIEGVTSSLIQCAAQDSPDREEIRILELQLNDLVMDAFQITNLEREIISKTLPPRDPIAMVEQVAVEQPEEVPLTAFATLAYPANDTDRTICAAALNIVEHSGGLSSMDHIEALLLVTHPDWCKVFLNQTDRRAFDDSLRSCPQALFVSRDESIWWKRCRDYLEKREAITISRGSNDQPINSGTAFASVEKSLPEGVAEVVRYALRALERIRDLRRDLSSGTTDQQVILSALEEDRRHQLAA